MRGTNSATTPLRSTVVTDIVKPAIISPAPNSSVKPAIISPAPNSSNKAPDIFVDTKPTAHFPKSTRFSEKEITPEKAAALVRSGDWVDYGFSMNFPVLLDKALSARKDALSNVNIRGGLNLYGHIAVCEEDPEQKAFTYNSWHFSGYERKLHDRGLCHYIPMSFRYLPAFYRNHLTVDVAFLAVSEINSDGYFSMGLTNSATREILKKARIVVLEVNEHYPFTLSVDGNNLIHIDEADYIVRGPHSPLPELPAAKATPIDIQIGTQITQRIESGSVVQLGIGGLPNTIGMLIADSDLKDLGCHTEMLGDAYVAMHESGKLTNISKQLHQGLNLWTLILGSRKVFEWAKENPALSSHPVDYVNAPEIIARNDKVVSVNSALEVDLYGQVCAESMGARHISGSGGQLDFLTGAFMSKGGCAYICLPSTYQDKTGEVRSRIVPIMTDGNIVTDPRSQMYCIATEYGIVNLAGCSTWERAEKIISIAHPDFRDELIKKAEKRNIWRRSNQ